MQEIWVQSLGFEDPLEEGMATHSSILAWRIPMDREAWRATVHVILKSQTWLCWAFFAARGLSLVVVSGGYSLLWHMGGFFCCRAWALGTWTSVVWHAGLVAPWHMRSPQTRQWTHVPCIGSATDHQRPDGQGFMPVKCICLENDPIQTHEEFSGVCAYHLH